MSTLAGRPHLGYTAVAFALHLEGDFKPFERLQRLPRSRDDFIFQRSTDCNDPCVRHHRRQPAILRPWSNNDGLCCEILMETCLQL